MSTTDPQIRQDGPRPEAILRRLYPHPLDRVWRAVTAAEHLAAWFPGAPEFELRAQQAPEVVLVTVTHVESLRLLAFDTGPGEPGDHARFELVEGTGHGARMVLMVTGADPAQQDAVLQHVP